MDVSNRAGAWIEPSRQHVQRQDGSSSAGCSRQIASASTDLSRASTTVTAPPHQVAQRLQINADHVSSARELLARSCPRPSGRHRRGEVIRAELPAGAHAGDRETVIVAGMTGIPGQAVEPMPQLLAISDTSPRRWRSHGLGAPANTHSDGGSHERVVVGGQAPMRPAAATVRSG